MPECSSPMGFRACDPAREAGLALSGRAGNPKLDPSTPFGNGKCLFVKYDAVLKTNSDSICVCKGIDVVKRCRDYEANPQTFDLIGKSDYLEKDVRGNGRFSPGRRVMPW